MSPERLVMLVRQIPPKAEHGETDYSGVSDETLKKLYGEIGYYAMSYLEVFEEVAEEIERREASFIRPLPS